MRSKGVSHNLKSCKIILTIQLRKEFKKTLQGGIVKINNIRRENIIRLYCSLNQIKEYKGKQLLENIFKPFRIFKRYFLKKKRYTTYKVSRVKWEYIIRNQAFFMGF